MIFIIVMPNRGDPSPEVVGNGAHPGTGENIVTFTVTLRAALVAVVETEVGADVVLLYEQADDDAATITAAPAEAPWQLTAGRHVLGSFETHPVSDPLTLELGETREIDVQLAATSGGFAGSVFAFDGAADRRDRGRSAGYGEEAGGGEADTVTLRLATEF